MLLIYLEQSKSIFIGIALLSILSIEIIIHPTFFLLAYEHLKITESSGRIKSISICCSWSNKIADGVLTYAISDANLKNELAASNAIQIWDRSIPFLNFTRTPVNESTTTSNTEPDLEIKFVNDLPSGGGATERIRGMTLHIFDDEGLVTNAIILISKSYFLSKFGDQIIQHIVMHEIGHALGLGDANYEGMLMSRKINQQIANISRCEVLGVIEANKLNLKNASLTATYK